jgi:hypothetical protein
VVVYKIVHKPRKPQLPLLEKQSLSLQLRNSQEMGSPRVYTRGLHLQLAALSEVR